MSSIEDILVWCSQTMASSALTPTLVSDLWEETVAKTTTDCCPAAPFRFHFLLVKVTNKGDTNVKQERWKPCEVIVLDGLPGWLLVFGTKAHNLLPTESVRVQTPGTGVFEACCGHQRFAGCYHTFDWMTESRSVRRTKHICTLFSDFREKF